MAQYRQASDQRLAQTNIHTEHIGNDKHWYWIFDYTDKYGTGTYSTVKCKELNTVYGKHVSGTSQCVTSPITQNTALIKLFAKSGPKLLPHKEFTCINVPCWKWIKPLSDIMLTCIDFFAKCLVVYVLKFCHNFCQYMHQNFTNIFSSVHVHVFTVFTMLICSCFQM